MSYKKLLDKQALKAFTLLKDLSVNATLGGKAVSNFDFDSNSITSTAIEPDVVKIVVIATKQVKSTVTKTILARLVDVGLVKQYATLTFQGETWKVGDIVDELGQVVTLNIYKELSNG